MHQAIPCCRCFVDVVTPRSNALPLAVLKYNFFMLVGSSHSQGWTHACLKVRKTSKINWLISCFIECFLIWPKLFDTTARLAHDTVDYRPWIKSSFCRLGEAAPSHSSTHFKRWFAKKNDCRTHLYRRRYIYCGPCRACWNVSTCSDSGLVVWARGSCIIHTVCSCCILWRFKDSRLEVWR